VFLIDKEIRLRNCVRLDRVLPEFFSSPNPPRSVYSHRTMNERYIRWWTPHMSRDFEMLVFGDGRGLPLILFQYPDATKATYNLETQLDIAALPGVFAMKNGVRNMRRWDTEIPVIRRERPNLQILTCHDEYLLHTMFDVDGALVGYGSLTPEPLIELIAAGKAKDYARAREIHDKLLPVTRTVYHRGSHMEGTVALKHGLVARGILEHATVRPPLLPLEAGAEVEIANALRSAGLVPDARSREFRAA